MDYTNLLLCTKIMTEEGDSLFEAATNKEKSPLSSVDLKTLQEDLILPAYAISNTVFSKPSLDGFMKASTLVPITSQTDKVNSSTIEQRPEGWYDPIVCKLFENVGYGKGEPRQLAELSSTQIGDVMQGLTITQCKLQMVGEKVLPSRAGIGSTPLKPVCIASKKKASTHHITVEVVDKPKERKSMPLCSSAFDWIGRATSHTSVFDWLRGQAAMSNQQTWL